ncbi:MAG TPA: biopolymer transporter ExbD [Tepidisphaeraceae bacterium]|nr:biopolymer transporter ExbD [Tepidisphaeraceae bacterium]
MRRHKMPDAHASHPNVTPLIDVVMCLIIFYMLVAKIGVNTGQDAKIELPTSLLGISLKDLGNTVTLNVARPPTGDEPLVTMLDPATGQMVDLKIIDGTKRPLHAFLKKLKGENAEFKVIIRGDQNLEYRFLEPVLITCSEAAVKNVNFAARVPQFVKTASE